MHDMLLSYLKTLFGDGIALESPSIGERGKVGWAANLYSLRRSFRLTPAAVAKQMARIPDGGAPPSCANWR